MKSYNTFLEVIGLKKYYSCSNGFLGEETNSIKAVDGTLFSSEEACRSYEIVLERVNALFREKEKNSSIEPFDLQMGFTKLLTKEGFIDAKTLIKYRYDFEKLVKLFNLDSQI